MLRTSHLLMPCLLIALLALSGCGLGDGSGSIDPDGDLTITDGDMEIEAYDEDSDGDAEISEACQDESFACEDNYALKCIDGRWDKTLCLDTQYCNYGACEDSLVDFPTDTGYHDMQSEWWYYTGHLHHEDQEWGFQVTIFQYDLEAMMGMEGMGYMCHVAVTDKIGAEHYHRDMFSLIPSKWSNDPYILEVSDCRFELGGDGNDHIIATIAEDKEKDGKASPWKLDIIVSPMKRATLHGKNGIVDMGDAAGTTSWYYSYTRMTATGELLTPWGNFEVSGQAWMDHQWGEFDNTEFRGWDWWSMQFDDNYEVMIFSLTDWDGIIARQSGTITDPDGMQTDLGDDGVSISNLRNWSSPHTDGIYPLDWDIEIKQMNWILNVTTSVDDQEMHNLAQNYWEGEASVRGSRNAVPVSGVGYTELAGYASDILD